MTLPTPSATVPAPGSHVRCVAGWVRLEGAVDPLAGADLLGEPSLYWERPLQQEGMAGWGQVAVRQAWDAGGAAALLSDLGAPDGTSTLRWLEGEGPDGLVGPWLGGVRFTAPGDDADWSGFGHARFVLRLVTALDAWNCAYLPESQAILDLLDGEFANLHAALAWLRDSPGGRAFLASPWPAWTLRAGLAVLFGLAVLDLRNDLIALS